MFNPYVNNMFPYPSNSPNSMEIPHVNGQNGAQAFQMPANSSVLLLDDNAPIVYLVRTDSACYKTIKPYSITEYKPEPPVDVRSLLNRIEAIERKINYEPDIATNEPNEQRFSSNRASQSVNEHDSSERQPAFSNAKLFSDESRI